MKLIRKLRSNMTFCIITTIVVLLTIYGIVVGFFGFASFSAAFKKEYAATTYHIADTAVSLINGENLNSYLSGNNQEEYRRTKSLLTSYCYRINVSLIYVIQVDTSDYGRFVSIFNPVNNDVDNSDYTEWELGYKRDTTNEEYRQKYKAIYDEESDYETVYRINTTDGQHPHITTIVPVKNNDEDVVALLCVQRPFRELQEARLPYIMNIVIATSVLAIIASLIAAHYIKNRFVKPIRKTSKEATRFAKENTKGEPLGEISKYEELSNLAHSIDTMETDMVQYIENLTAITAEREKADTELALAKSIQEDSLPTTFPAFPDRKEFDIYASMTPAKMVGGDFYNFFLIDDDHLAIVIGDVSGKSVPGALFMMVANILLSDRTRMGGTPAEILAFVNNRIYETNKADMFVTLWLGILEISTGRIVAANAGHEDAAVCHKDGSFELFKTKHDFVIGAMKNMQYRDFEIRLGKGDKLFLYTDGIPEATDKYNQMYSLDRMLDTLNRYKDRTPQEILDGIHQSINAFVGEAPQFDDVTMVCLELK
ncbi:MAG: PP2C family protein-serine/threonine phosphatase [Clostridiales bacterium]|nr:PP2C family protein-serine/threonine phosphatase [Clostridiales bacterium]